MASNNTRSMFFALLLCLGLSGAASAQSVSTTPAQAAAPTSMSAAEAKEAAPAVSTPEAAIIAPVAIDDATEANTGRGARFTHWSHSTVLYQRMYVRISMHSTPEWRAR